MEERRTNLTTEPIFEQAAALARELDSGTLKATLFQNQFEYGRESVHRIFEYLKCIRLEQNILKSFPEEEILLALETFHPGYGNMIENLCEAVALSGVITEGRERLRYRNAVL